MTLKQLKKIPLAKHFAKSPTFTFRGKISYIDYIQEHCPYSAKSKMKRLGYKTSSFIV